MAHCKHADVLLFQLVVLFAEATEEAAMTAEQHAGVAASA